jgi:hypothetical protein
MTTPACDGASALGETRSTLIGDGFCRNLRMTPAASAGDNDAVSVSRSRRIARACSCETRDSFTPISRPICFMVASP